MLRVATARRGRWAAAGPPSRPGTPTFRHKNSVCPTGRGIRRYVLFLSGFGTPQRDRWTRRVCPLTVFRPSSIWSA